MKKKISLQGKESHRLFIKITDTKITLMPIKISAVLL